MIYERFIHAAQGALAIWLGVLLVIVLWRLLITGDAMSGLLKTVPSDGQQVERTQSLVIVLAVVGYYAYAGAQAIGSGEPSQSMPELPDALLALVGGSQAVFLAEKTARYRRR